MRLQPHLAVGAAVSHRTDAAVGAEPVGAAAAVFTGLGVALVTLVLTEEPEKAQRTAAGEAVDAIDARPVVEARAEDERKDCNAARLKGTTAEPQQHTNNHPLFQRTGPSLTSA